MKISPTISLFLILLFFLTETAITSPHDSHAPNAGISLDGPAGQAMQAIILVPADSVIDGYDVLKMMNPDDPVGKVVYQLFRESYMYKAVVYYYLAQNYLVNAGKLKEANPAYLLLSQNQGGFPRFGFYLQQGDTLHDKTSVPYIELVKNNTDPEYRLGSMTQIYPHEMGHIIYHLLSPDSDTIIPASVDIHFASMTTDYQTAFNEGFAIHFESTARIYEPDDLRKAEVMKDFDDKKGKVGRKITGYKRDFTWPFRPGFYRISMLTWYQVLEDIKRNEWVFNHRMKYKNTSVLFRNAEKSLFYRNSGIETDSLLRLPQRAFATEGIIASFFSGLMESNARNMFREDEFYLKFLHTRDSINRDVLNSIDPLDKQYMKIFTVLHRHINQTLTVQSQFVDFVSAYIKEYPGEKQFVTALFKKSTGLDYPPRHGKELWLINPDHEHGVLVMEQFGGITVPFYTFNINAATEADLLTFDEIGDQEAKLIINHLRENGPLNTLEDLEKIPGLSTAALVRLKESPFDPQFFKDFEEEGMTLSVNKLILSYVKQLLLMWIIFGLIAIIPALLLQYKIIGSIRLKSIPGLLLRFLVFLLIALAAVATTSSPVLYFCGMAFLIICIAIIIMRSRENRLKLLITSAPMVLLMIYGLL